MFIKYLVVIFCLVYLSGNEINAQNKIIDSLIIAIETTKRDTAHVTTLLRISKLSNDRQNFKEAKRYAQRSIDYAKLIDYRSGLINGYLGHGNIYVSQANFDSSIICYTAALKICDTIRDKASIANLNQRISSCYIAKSNLKLGLHYILLSIGYYEKIKDTDKLIQCYNMMAIVFAKQNNEEQALNYFIKAGAMAKKSNRKILLARTQNNIGNFYRGKDDKKSIFYFKEALRLYKETKNNEAGIANTLSNIGDIYLRQKSYFAADDAFKSALIIAKKIDNQKLISDIYIGLGISCEVQNKLSEANSYFQKAQPLALKTGDAETIVLLYTSLSKLELKQNNFKKALLYQKLLSSIKDSILNKDLSKQITEMASKYEAEKKDNEIKLLSMEKEEQAIRQKLVSVQSNKDRIFKNSIIFVLTTTLLLLTTIYGYISIRKQKIMQSHFTQQLIQNQEEERRRISKDLHDSIGQKLSIIKSNPQNAEELIQSTINELRSIALNMHPIQLEKLGFRKAVELIINEVEKSSGIFFSHQIDEINLDLDKSQQINLYRIIQEALNNIVKHSNAKNARVTVLKTKYFITTIIVDNGDGFSLPKINKNSMGLDSIKERVKIINGKLRIENNRNRTLIEVKIGINS